MATSGQKSVKVTSWNTLKFNWWVASQSVANNSSVVRWELQLTSDAYGKISSSASKDWSVTVNGTKYSGTNTIGIDNNMILILAQDQITIPHSADGSKTFSFSFSQEFGITFSGSSIGTISGSGTGTLNTIPRATTPTLSASSANMGASITINTPRASSSFTHDLAYSFAGSGWVSIATGVTTSKAWTVPDLATRIPNATSGTMTIRCITKNGSTSIGTKTVLLTVKVPTSVVPSISAVTLTEATAGLAEQFGKFIQSKSKVKATITAAGAKGSTIKSYSTTFQGKTYSGSSWTSDVVNNAGTVSMTTKVTDSRGRTASKTTSFGVLGYYPPRVTRFDAYRCDENEAFDNNGPYVLIGWAYGAPELNGGNTVEAVIERKVYGTTEWETLYTSTSLWEDLAIVFMEGFSSDNQWDVRLSLTDWFGAVSYYPAILPTADVIMDILNDGTGVAFGKVAEASNVLDVDWQLRTLGGVKAIVLENGTDLNDLTTPNTFTGKNANNGEYKNCPVASATFTLEVFPAGDGTQRLQRFTTCDKYAPQTFERFYYGSAWGEWLRVSNFKGKVLWEGGYYMNDNQTATLSEAVSEQVNGIVLVFSRYSDATVRDYHLNSFFVSKKLVELMPGIGHTFMMTTDGSFSVLASKYLYINDKSIAGNANNQATGTGTSGVKYENNGFVLRYVLGV